MFLVKLDSSGNVLWAKNNTGTSIEEGYSVCTDKKGNIYVTGIFKGTNITLDTIVLTNTMPGYSDVFLAKYDKNGNVISIEEKPKEPKSNYAVTGLYFYSNDVVEKAKNLKPSVRGELEITDLNRLYLEEKRLKVKLLGRGMAWLDTGTHESLLQASNFIATIEERQGLKASCIEEIAYKRGFITKEQLLKLAEPMKKNQYGQYLLDIASDKILTIYS